MRSRSIEHAQLRSDFRGGVMAPGQIHWKGIAVYLALVFGLSWTIDLALRPFVLYFQVRGAMVMLVPALAAWVVRGPVGKEGFADSGLGLRFNRSWRVYAAAYAIIPAAILVGFALSSLSGIQHWGIQTLGTVLKSFGAAGLNPGAASATRLPVGAVAAWAIGSLTVFLPMNMLFTFGEEFGWRGYLLVRLESLGRTNAALIVGVVWGIWHAPYIVFDNYVYPGHHVAGVFLMIVFTTSLGVLFAWLRFASGSIWPCVLAHAAFNAQAELGYIVLSPASSLLRPPAGIFALIPLIAIAAWLIFTGRLDRSQMRAATIERPSFYQQPR